MTKEEYHRAFRREILGYSNEAEAHVEGRWFRNPLIALEDGTLLDDQE